MGQLPLWSPGLPLPLGVEGVYHQGCVPSRLSEFAGWYFQVYGGIFALRAHCALLLDYVPPKEPRSTPLGNALRIR